MSSTTARINTIFIMEKAKSVLLSAGLFTVQGAGQEHLGAALILHQVGDFKVTSSLLADKVV